MKGFSTTKSSKICKILSLCLGELSRSFSNSFLGQELVIPTLQKTPTALPFPKPHKQPTISSSPTLIKPHHTPELPSLAAPGELQLNQLASPSTANIGDVGEALLSKQKFSLCVQMVTGGGDCLSLAVFGAVWMAPALFASLERSLCQLGRGAALSAWQARGKHGSPSTPLPARGRGDALELWAGWGCQVN